MSLEHSPTRAVPGLATPSEPNDPDYWHSLIDERKAARFAGLSVRRMQGLRYQGGGPVFVRLSIRCVRYRRIDIWEWANARLRRSTSDPGPRETT